jgi:hypothetical protein
MSAQSRQILSAIISSLERGQQLTDDRKEKQRLARLIVHARTLARRKVEWGGNSQATEATPSQRVNEAGN